MSDSVLDYEDPVWHELDGVSRDELFIRGLRSALDTSSGDDLAARLMSIQAAIQFSDDPDRLQRVFDAYVGSPELGDARGSGSEFDLVEIIKNKIQYSDNRDLWGESCESHAHMARELRDTRVEKYLTGDNEYSLNNMANKLDVPMSILFRFENWDKNTPASLSGEKIVEYAARLGYGVRFELYNRV